MAEYINKQQILEKAKEYQNNPFGIPLIIAETEKADAVDLVMCKDCKHRSTSDFYSFYCGLQDVDCKDDDFCSYGERRDT